MYQKIDGVAMGSPIAPPLANIFVEFSTFFIFSNETKCNQFFKNTQYLTPILGLYPRKKINNPILFLDVLVKRSNNKFLTSVYRKPTFTGQYTR